MGTSQWLSWIATALSIPSIRDIDAGPLGRALFHTLVTAAQSKTGGWLGGIVGGRGLEDGWSAGFDVGGLDGFLVGYELFVKRVNTVSSDQVEIRKFTESDETYTGKDGGAVGVLERFDVRVAVVCFPLGGCKFSNRRRPG